METVALVLFGIMLGSIPLISIYIHKLVNKKLKEMETIRDSLNKTLQELNSLHNNALKTYSSIDGRLTKLETTNAAKEFGRNIK